MASFNRHSPILLDAWTEGVMVTSVISNTGSSSVYFLNCIVTLFVYRRLLVSEERWRMTTFLSQNGGHMHSEVCKSSCLCIFMFVNTYTQKCSCTNSVVHHLWQKKKTEKKERNNPLISVVYCFFLFFPLLFFLWIYDSIDTVILGFVHFINRETHTGLRVAVEMRRETVVLTTGPPIASPVPPNSTQPHSSPRTDTRADLDSTLYGDKRWFKKKRKKKRRKKKSN